VFHFAPDWNPAVLDQANARAYRRGQDRPVTIHNLFYSETIEERMMERVSMRRALSEAALLGTDVGPTFEELRAAIERDPEK
jgi:SNF2 family DNA or RNA helicase